MFGIGLVGCAWGVYEREGKKGGLSEGEKWPQVWTPKIFDRSPPLVV